MADKNFVRPFIRPVEREKMRPWLEKLLNNKKITGLEWIDERAGTFKIPWKHGSKQTWKLDDADLFQKWAVHTGKYIPERDSPNAKRWKANFRCALNSLPDVEEVVEKNNKKGTNAYKVYCFTKNTVSKIKRKKKIVYRRSRSFESESDSCQSDKFSRIDFEKSPAVEDTVAIIPDFNLIMKENKEEILPNSIECQLSSSSFFHTSGGDMKVRQNSEIQKLSMPILKIVCDNDEKWSESFMEEEKVDDDQGYCSEEKTETSISILEEIEDNVVYSNSDFDSWDLTGLKMESDARGTLNCEI